MPYIETISMDVDEFIKIAGNPNQRDTEHHAKTANKNHLKEFHESHSKVAVAKYGNRICVLDGHTRRYLWERGLLKQPKILFVDVWEVKDKNEAVNMYGTYDNKFAMESVADRVSGALRLMGIDNANKSFSRNAGIPSAIRMIDKATGKFNPNNTVSGNLMKYKKEIRKLIELQWSAAASISMGRPGTPSCVIAAFLIIYKMYGDDSLGFWDGYYKGTGMEMFKSGRDGSLAAAEWIIRVREKDELKGVNLAMNVEAILNAYEFYWDEKIVKDIRSLYKKDFKKSQISQLSDVLKNIGYF